MTTGGFPSPNSPLLSKALMIMPKRVILREDSCPLHSIGQTPTLLRNVAALWRIARGLLAKQSWVSVVLSS